MIPSTDISIDADTAWWAMPRGWPSCDQIDMLDRPCDLCGKKEGWSGYILADLSPIPCRMCDGTGRHTFDIETKWPADCGRGCDFNHFPMTHRVHVVDVLPIVDSAHSHGIPDNCIDMRFGKHPRLVHQPNLPMEAITLPPNAAPGDWLVQLAIHERNQ